MEPLQVQKAIDTLEKLDAISGQARNQRLKILGENRSDPVLLEIFRLTYDWRIDIGVVPVGLGPGPNKNLHEFSLGQSWIEFKKLVAETRGGSSFLTGRRKFAKFFEQADPLIGKWAQRIINRDLQIYLSIKMLSKVWAPDIFVPFQVPKENRDSGSWVRTFIFIQDHQPVTFTDAFRKFAFANDAFARQLARICPEGVIEGYVTSSDWKLTSSLLSHHVSTMSKAGFKSIFYGIRFEAINFYHSDDFYRGIFLPDNRQLMQIAKNLNPRTSISICRESAVTMRTE